MSDYPKGNAQVGDEVWWREDASRLFDEPYRVVEVGLPNQFGQPLNIRIRKEDGTEQVVSPFLQQPCPTVLLLPAVIPEKARRFIEGRVNLICVRDGGNNDFNRYVFFCCDCQAALFTRIQTIETCGFRLDEDPIQETILFYEGKPDMEDCTTTLICGCPDREYPLPPHQRHDGEYEGDGEGLDDGEDEEEDDA